jgi:hypothetical protein
MSESGSSWRCSLATLGHCLDQKGKPVNDWIPFTSLSCPNCELSRPNFRRFNARDTNGLISDTKSLTSFLLPVVQYVDPLVEIIAQYLRLVNFETGDCVEVPDWTGQVSRAVIIRTFKIDSADWYESLTGRRQVPKILALVHFCGWSNAYDEIVDVNTVRTLTYAPLMAQNSFHLYVDTRTSWLRDARWTSPTTFICWRRHDHSGGLEKFVGAGLEKFVAAVCDGKGFSNIRHKPSRETLHSTLPALI